MAAAFSSVFTISCLATIAAVCCQDIYQAVPASLKMRISPLDGSTMNTSSDLCRQAHLLCDTRIPFISAKPTTFNHASQPNVIFASPSLLRKGSQLIMPDMREEVPLKSFLPSSLVEQLPYTNCTLIRSVLGIPPDSNLSLSMESSVKACTSPDTEAEEKVECFTSLNRMLEFVSNVLGSSKVEAITPEDTEASEKQVVITAVEAIGNKKKAPVACHSFVFPFALYYCHSIKGTTVYQASIATLDGKLKSKYPVVCHELAAGQMCHWMFGSNILWMNSN